MRFHIVGLPHTQTNLHHSACAFTMKIYHFIQMMTSLGHECIHYGVEGSEVECDDIIIMSKGEQERFFGSYNPEQLYNVDWSGKAEYWKLLNDRAAVEINKRSQKQDFVCLIMGTLNKPLHDQLTPNKTLTVEYGIGYNGTFSNYRVFESYAHMHKIWGAQGSYDPDGKFYDSVIPNYLQPTDYPFQSKKDNYFLYLGRLIQRKGIHIAIETCKRIGTKLVIAGQGCKEYDPQKHSLLCEDGQYYQYDNMEFVGFATGKKRADLFSKAKAVFVPTVYIEPFGAVAIEAQMAGTPAITTDFGAFPETVEHGRTGFRCHTLNEFVTAACNVSNLNPYYIHKRAVNMYSMDKVRWRYQTYFQQLLDLWDNGWYALHQEIDEFWLKGYR